MQLILTACRLLFHTSARVNNKVLLYYKKVTEVNGENSKLNLFKLKKYTCKKFTNKKGLFLKFQVNFGLIVAACKNKGFATC